MGLCVRWFWTWQFSFSVIGHCATTWVPIVTFKIRGHQLQFEKNFYHPENYIGSLESTTLLLYIIYFISLCCSVLPTFYLHLNHFCENEFRAQQVVPSTISSLFWGEGKCPSVSPSLSNVFFFCFMSLSLLQKNFHVLMVHRKRMLRNEWRSKFEASWGHRL